MKASNGVFVTWSEGSFEDHLYQLRHRIWRYYMEVIDLLFEESNNNTAFSVDNILSYFCVACNTTFDTLLDFKFHLQFENSRLMEELITMLDLKQNQKGMLVLVSYSHDLRHSRHHLHFCLFTFYIH
jgi:hypothetical protein